MERAGLVERTHLKEDRRVSNIEITQKGRELHDKVAKYHRLFILEKFKGLSDQEVDDLLKLLGKTVHVLNPEGAVFNVDVQDNQGNETPA
jgi:DNA-binding MarR family transcriptional regulator